MLKPPPFSEQDTNESIRSIKSIDLSALCTGLLEGEVQEPESIISADEEHACWGGRLKEDHSECTPGFFTGQAHFKNKFCARPPPDTCRSCSPPSSPRVRTSPCARSCDCRRSQICTQPLAAADDECAGGARLPAADPSGLA